MRRVSLPLMLTVILCPPPVIADDPNLGQIVMEAKGYVVPMAQVSVSPKVSGQVVEMLVEEGKRVTAGEVIARLNSGEYEATHRLALAELKLAEAGLLKAKDGASKADIAVAQAKLELAQAKAALAIYRLDSTVVRAPINGTVLTKRADIGNWINPSATQGTVSLCELADFRTMDVELWVQERDLAKIGKGQRCQIRLEAFPQSSYGGYVARILPIADRAKGAVGIRVRVEIPDKDESFRPEMSAVVTIGAKK